MRMLHLADLHLGKRVNGFDLLDDQQYILQQILTLCEQRRVDAVLLAGDIYDTATPPAAAMTLLDSFLTALCERQIAVLAVAGNHDSAERLDYAAGLLTHQGVYLAGRFTGAPRLVTLRDEFGAVEFCLLPFIRAATVRHYLPQAAVTDYDSAVAAALEVVPFRESRRVLLAHQMVVSGGAAPQPGGSESGLINVGTVESIDAARFSGFAYTALGHIHRPQRVGADTVRYAGSPLCYHLDECGAQKSAVLVTLDAAGVADMELLPLLPRRAMRHLTGPLAELTDPRRVSGEQDYIWATLTDPTPLPDAMAVLRAAYPNAMRLEYAPRAAGTELEPLAAGALQAKPFAELFADFFEQQNGRPLTEAERHAVHELHEEVLP